MPAMKLAQAEPVACEVALVQAAQLADRHRDKLVEILGPDDGCRELADARFVDRCIIADDRADDLGELLAVAKTQRIWLRQRLANDGVALARALVRPRDL